MSAPVGAGVASPAVQPVLLAISAILWVSVELRQALRHRPEAKVADRGTLFALRFFALVGVVGALIGRRALPSWTIGTRTAAEWIGLAFLWCGFGLRGWSFHTLGRYFTFTVQTSADQPVISTGPYRFVRHPSYAGILLAVVGVGFILDNWASLVVLMVATTCGLIYRITIEERALSEDLGGRYQSYAAGRKRLVPFVW
jgi:protein-S-isoprenylcysteine O-methyltransferase Ste14